MAQPSTAEAARTVHLHRDGHDRLRLRLPARHAGLLAADVALVDLDSAGEAVAVGGHHRRAQPMQHRPPGLIAAQPSARCSPSALALCFCAWGQYYTEPASWGPYRNLRHVVYSACVESAGSHEEDFGDLYWGHEGASSCHNRACLCLV